MRCAVLNYEKQEFSSEDFDDFESGALFQDVEFRRCYFQGCSLSVTRDPSLRSTVRNVRLIDCGQRGCSLDTAVLEDVLVDGFKTNGQLFQTWGAVFNRVVLKGKIDRLMLSSVVSPGLATPAEQRAFDETNAEYYRHVEWALDISQGEFKELDIRGLPGELIRRDPETQVLVTREKALQVKWRSLPFRENVWLIGLNLFLESGVSATVFDAEKRNPKFRNYLADLQLMRAAGLAEPD
jgi:hypothetical protein